MSGCQYLGPEYDPRKHRGATPYCGKPVVSKNYCADHYYVVYARGTSVNGKRKEKALQEEIESVKLAEQIAEYENE